ncbi:MAG: DUF3883 domain-containing protein [Rummeliibacillus sp.]
MLKTLFMCSAGYDILSFELDGRPKYIDCKTSVGKNKTFVISANEWSKAKQYREQYYIYRVINLNNNPDITILKNPYEKFEEKSIILAPTSYKVKY